MCQKIFYVKSLEKQIKANVSLRFNRVTYEYNNETIVCSLSDFVLNLGAIEVNENTEQIIAQHFLLTEQAKAKRSKELMAKQKKESESFNSHIQKKGEFWNGILSKLNPKD